MSKSRRPMSSSQSTDAPARDSGAAELAAPEMAYGNAAMAEMLAQNGPGDDPQESGVDDAAVARENPDFGPTGITLRNPGSSAGMQRTVYMDLTPLSTAYEGLHIEEHFHGHSVDGIGADDLQGGASLSDFIAELEAGEEGTFTADMAGSFIDYHGGSPVEGDGFRMLTEARRRNGFTVHLYQSYTWNGHDLGSFVVSRRIAYSNPGDMSTLRMEIGKFEE